MNEKGFTHSGGDFPLTGHPAMDVASWKKIFRTCQDFIFHSFQRVFVVFFIFAALPDDFSTSKNGCYKRSSIRFVFAGNVKCGAMVGRSSYTG